MCMPVRAPLWPGDDGAPPVVCTESLHPRRRGGLTHSHNDTNAPRLSLDVGGWQVVVTDGHAVLPEGMTHLPAWALFNRTPLVSIGSSAFEGCFSLVSVDLPASLTHLHRQPRLLALLRPHTTLTFPATLPSIRRLRLRPLLRPRPRHLPCRPHLHRRGRLRRLPARPRHRARHRHHPQLRLP